MKNTKIFVVLSGVAALLLGFAAKNRTDFQTHLGKAVKVHSTRYIVASVCGDQKGPVTPTKEG